MRSLLLALALLVGGRAPAAQPAYEAALTRVLVAVVGEDGLVDYGALAGPQNGAFRRVVAAVEDFDPATLRTDAQKTAFLLNAYNVHVLARVLAHPRAANLERDGLFVAFFQTPVEVAGRMMTLNELEHGLLRRQNTVNGAAVPVALRSLRPSRLDPRIHVGLNCAAVSCPRLRRAAFSARTLDATLNTAFAEFAGSDRHVQATRDAVVLSRIVDWYGADFEAGGEPIGDVLLGVMRANRPGRAALRRALAGKTAAELRAARGVRFAYDWTVNRR